MVKFNMIHNKTSFIGNVCVGLNIVLFMIHLLSEFVHFGGRKYVDYEGNIFIAVPEMIVDFAFHSRIYS